MTDAIGERFFRHEHGRLLAVLVRRFGAARLEAVEDAVQWALLAAVETWPRQGLPDRPSAWLYRVAHNRITGALRTEGRRARLLAHEHDDDPVGWSAPEAVLPHEVGDAMLHMLLVCCDPEISRESQLVLALETLCGFDVSEIAERLFTSEASVYKRKSRARARLRMRPLDVDADLSNAELMARVPTVLAVLYAMFTEGHLSSRADGAVSTELCDEAGRLATLLAEHPIGARPEAFALVALMHLHAARLPARCDGAGGLILLEHQDRQRWDPDRIALGMRWLQRSAAGDRLSRYHAEAAIAAEHCMAPSLDQTRWDRIVACYERLEAGGASPIHRLNRAVATAQWRGPSAGLAVLDGLAAPAWLAESHLLHAVLADLHRRCGHHDLATEHRRRALAAAPSEAIHRLLRHRLGDPEGEGEGRRAPAKASAWAEIDVEVEGSRRGTRRSTRA